LLQAVSVYPDSNKIGGWSGDSIDDLIFVRDTALQWSHGEEGWDKAGQTGISAPHSLRRDRPEDAVAEEQAL
jgi:hypothetical protein